jgi:hypothetical protein
MSFGWETIVEKLKKEPDECHILRIPIDTKNFGGSLVSSLESQISTLCKQGEIPVYLTLLQSGVIAVTYCIKEGSRNDEDGLNVDHDNWIHSYVDQNGRVIVPFELEGSVAFEQAAKEYGDPW